jgi:hypothetical protein
VQESGDTAETLDRRIKGMRAVSEAMKDLLEDAEDKRQSQELEAMKMSIDTLVRTTKEVMAEQKIEGVAKVQQEPRSQRERRRQRRRWR